MTVKQQDLGIRISPLKELERLWKNFKDIFQPESCVGLYMTQRERVRVCIYEYMQYIYVNVHMTRR